MLTFGELLIKYTERAGISDAELARTTGVQRQTIFRWKEGLVARPRYREDVLRIAARLRLTPEERDELLLAAGFPPESPAGPAPPGTPSGAVAVGLQPDPADAALPEEILAESATASNPDMAALGSASLSSLSTARPANWRRTAWLWAAVVASALLLAIVSSALIPRIFPPAPPATPTPVQVTLNVPAATATMAPTPIATPITARAGEKLLLVAPFVGYTSDDLRFNVAGRIQEALIAEIEESKLKDARAVIWPDPLMAQEQARLALASAQAAAVIWGEYDAGRVRANVTISGTEEAQWVNPVDSPADLRLAINEAVPHAARVFALFALGQLYRDAGQDAQALGVFQKALLLQPDDDTTAAALHFYKGTLLPRVQGTSIDVLTQSIDDFTQVLASKPAWENALYNRGTAYLGRALLSPQEGPDLDAAIADLSAVVDRQPHRFDPLLNRGIAFYQRHSPGDLDAAIADFTHAAEARPQDYRAYYHRALALIRAGDRERWEADLEQARTLNPTYAPILNAFCWGYGLAGQPQIGLTYCEQAVSADPSGSSYDSRAIVYAQLDRYAEAATDLERYLAWVKQAYPGLYTKHRGPEAEAWIAALREGRNPFTPDALARLREG